MADYLASKGYKVLYIGFDSKKLVLDEDEFRKLFTNKEELELFTEIKPNLFSIPFIVKKENAIEKGMDELLYKLESFYGSTNTIFYVGHPCWMRYLGKITQETMIIYDCMDDWEQFVLDLGFGIESYIYDERKLAGISDSVITSAKKLYCKMYDYSSNIYYMPNGVRLEDYQITEYIPEDIKSIKKPIILFMGTITGWVDLKLMGYMAKKRPEYSYVYIGNIVEVDKKDIPQQDNIYYLGKKKYTELVNYLKQARVAIIPFKENRLTASVSPLKFYEYISAGIPVVSTMFPDLLGIKGANIAGSYSDFVEAIDYFVQMKEEEYSRLQQELIETSSQFEWKQMLDNLILYLENKKQYEDKREFINKTINYYRDYSNNPLIKNELLTMNNIVGNYDETIKLGEELNDNGQTFDIEQLALAYIRTDRIEQAIKYLKIFINNNEDYNVYKQNVNNILKRKDCNTLLEIFLLKICYRHWEAIKLCESLIREDYIDPFIYAMLSSLYYEVGEYDISAQLALVVFNHIQDKKIEDIFSPSHLVNLIDYCINNELYELGENIGLLLYEIGFQDMGIEKLGEVYFSKNYSISMEK